MKVAIAFGTRPEAIKLAPVICELRRRSGFEVQVVLTAQHRELLDQVLRVFDITGDVDLDVMRPRQTLPELSARVLIAMDELLARSTPDALIVQGDTTSAFAAALSAFYRGIAVVHVEAGLRTPSTLNPFPEELNRRLISRLALLHCAATERAAVTLRAEGAPPDTVFVTGNPVVDALHEIRRSDAFRAAPLPITTVGRERLILLTMHRRESWDAVIDVCAAVKTVVRSNEGVRVVIPVHPNPAVRETITRELGGVAHVDLIEPLDYLSFVKLMEASHIILTDSGGVQEEAPVLGRPVLVLRDATERTEAVDAGVARLVGTERSSIVDATLELLTDQVQWAKMSRAVSPFGDGRAAARIADVMDRERGRIHFFASLPGNPRRSQAMTSEP